MKISVEEILNVFNRKEGVQGGSSPIISNKKLITSFQVLHSYTYLCTLYIYNVQCTMPGICYYQEPTEFSRPNFLVVKNGGIGSERFSKKLLWKIFNIYMVVICHNRFFQKRVTKKNFFFRDPFFTYKKGVSEIDDRNARRCF